MSLTGIAMKAGSTTSNINKLILAREGSDGLAMRIGTARI